MPRARVFVDLAYFADVLTADTAARKTLASYVRAFAAAFDPGLEHITFGTDWIMLGIKAGYSDYTRSVATFLSDDCGFTAEAVERILLGNALRFLGLQPGGRTRERLVRFYEQHGLPSKV